MKNLFKAATIMMTALAILSCKKDPIDTGKDPVNPDPKPEPKPEIEDKIDYTEDIEFTLELLSVEAGSAEFQVTHSGTKDDTWYGFATTSTNVMVSIEDMVAELTENDDKVTGLLNGTSKTIKVENLKPETEYTYIVFAITKEGDVYGTYEYESFTTLMKYETNPAWEVEYTGRGFVGEEEYENTVTVTSKDNNMYFMTIVTKDRFDETDRGALLKEELEAFKEFIDKYNAYYEVETLFKDWCYKGSAVDAFGLELGYTYVAMAIGATADGKLTGLYAYSEEFQPYEEEMTPEYASWIGDWTFTGSNGVAFDVNIAKEKSNKTFVMTGWEGEEASKCKVIIDWYGDSWMLWTQFLYGGTNATYGAYEVYICPVDANSGYRYLGEYPICVGAVTSDGTRMVGAYLEGTLTFTHMQFIAEWSDGPRPITRTKDFPHFPITVTPRTSTLSTDLKGNASITKNSMVERKAVNIYQPKKFQAYDLQKYIIK